MEELQRAHNRLPLESRVYIELDAPAAGGGGDSEIAVCRTLDVSARGLQVALGEALTEGAFLQIGVDFPEDGGEDSLYRRGNFNFRDFTN